MEAKFHSLFAQGVLITMLPTNKQHQIIIGGLLGDGYVSRPRTKNENSRYVEQHCADQKDYLSWIQENLEDFGAKIAERKTYDKRYDRTYYSYEMWTSRLPMWNEYRNLIYDSNGEKQMSLKILDEVEPLALAVWIMDDGYMNKKHKQVFLYTHRYGFTGNLMVKEWFKSKWDINATICDHNVRGKIMHHLFFPTKESKKIVQIIEPYVVSSMKYKIGDQNQA